MDVANPLLLLVPTVVASTEGIVVSDAGSVPEIEVEVEAEAVG